MEISSSASHSLAPSEYTGGFIIKRLLGSAPRISDSIAMGGTKKLHF